MKTGDLITLKSKKNFYSAINIDKMLNGFRFRNIQCNEIGIFLEFTTNGCKVLFGTEILSAASEVFDVILPLERC